MIAMKPDPSTSRAGFESVVARHPNAESDESACSSPVASIASNEQVRPSKKALGDAFMIGLDRVDRISHRITAPDGSFFELSMPGMQLLVALAERTGRFVEIQELLAEIWGATEESLDQAAAEIAHHFGDEQREEPRYLVGDCGRGFKLLQTVRGEAVPVNSRYSRLFLRELGRRKVFRAAGAYCIIAFVLLQISDATFEALRLPDAAVPILLIALVVGFPLVVLLAWFLEITSKGVEPDAESGWFRRMGRRWEAVALSSLFSVSILFAVFILRAVDPSTMEPTSQTNADNSTGDAMQVMGPTRRRSNLELAGAGHLDAGDLDSALFNWQQAHEIAESASSYHNLGRIHYLRGDYRRAVELLRLSVVSHPASDELWGQLGFAFARALGADSSEAMNAFREGERLARRHGETLTEARRSAYLASLGRLAEAAAVAASIVEGASADPMVHYWAAIALAKVRDERRTRRAITRALNLGLSRPLLANEPELSPYAYLWSAR